MKEFQPIAFDEVQCRKDLERLQALLNSKQELSERQDLQPLFKESPQLAAFLGTCVPRLGPANRLAFEFPIFGDFAADLVIGNVERQVFCAVELEDARPHSIFHKLEGKATSEWGHRLEHGFGQLVDWFFAFDDYKNSAGFSKHFGSGHIEFSGMLLIGRGRPGDISEHERTRLRWRSNRVTINTHKILCLTYDELYETLNNDWRLLSLKSPKKNGGTANSGTPTIS